MPNADNDGREIIEKIKTFTDLNPERSVWFFSLGQIRYLSVIKYSLAVVGNSSSGLLEVPSFKTATINIGSRQSGRIIAKSVINCQGNYNSIVAAFKKLNSLKFKKVLKSTSNPFFKKNTSRNICKTIERAILPLSLKKKFYDLKI